MKKTLYISDLDGTLLNSRAEVSEKSKAIISRLITEKNILFLLPKNIAMSST